MLTLLFVVLCAVVLIWLFVDIFTGTALASRMGSIIALFVAAGVVLFGVLGFGAFFGGGVGLLVGAAFYHFLTRGQFGPF